MLDPAYAGMAIKQPMTGTHDPVESAELATESAARALSDKTIKLPSLPKTMEELTALLIRGLADTLALRIHHHTVALFQRWIPADLSACAMYQTLEEAHIDAMGQTRRRRAYFNTT